MDLYTREDVLKRAWVADAKQADLMIDAIAASYRGDIDEFHCLINTVANIHWMSEALKRYCPPVAEIDFNELDFNPEDFG
jgi:hypothetical protein